MNRNEPNKAAIKVDCVFDDMQCETTRGIDNSIALEAVC